MIRPGNNVIAPRSLVCGAWKGTVVDVFQTIAWVYFRDDPLRGDGRLWVFGTSELVIVE